MLVLLPVIFFFQTSVVVNRYFKVGWRISWLVSAVLTGTIITFLTEVLSLFHSFSFYPVALSWSVLTIVSISFGLPVFSSKVKLWDSSKLSSDEKALLCFIEVILIITGITAIASAPNSWDSMTYHLARVEHWIQNKTVAYYPTHILRQLNFCPWAEFALAHIRLLCSWDPAVNLLQWFSMAGSLLCVCLITGQLGGSCRAQLISCLAAITLPMGILQSVSTQNDYVETFWLLCFIFFVNEIRRHFRWLFVFSAGLSLGLALLTKGYGYVLMVPFLVFLIVSISGLSRRIKSIFIIVLCAVLLNIGYYERNQAAFGSISVAKGGLVNSSFDLKVTVGNLLRNTAKEVDTPFYSLNCSIDSGFAQLSSWLGINLYYDPHASVNLFVVQDFRRAESYSGNFVHMILFMTVIILCWFTPRQSRGLLVYTGLICIAGILFCSVIRYQEWVTRFHLPIFIMFCPVFGVFMDRGLSARTVVALGGLFLLNAVPFLFSNELHRWFEPGSIWVCPINEQYYLSGYMVDVYTGAAEKIKDSGCHEIGIIEGPDSWEYPLWRLLKTQPSSGQWRIEHINVDHYSSHIPYPLGSFHPCAVVTIEDALTGTTLSDKQYKKIWDSRDLDYTRIAVYLPVKL